MNIAESRIPQDGSTEFTWESKAYDIRISTFPLTNGENVVMRILDKSQLLLGLENLGFLEDDIETLKKSLSVPYGMIIVTGPTGSGKTTTLYSALSTINSVFKNIYTIEDPVEYQLPLIRQSQINVKAGLTFAAGLRSILRQDPDVILVGEMRDMETAELAIRSALTGHLVFSTLHTNNAASSLPRLVDMGIEPFLLASTIDTIVSQRLVRILCSKCKEAYSPTGEMRESIGVAVPENAIFFRAKGCKECNDTGYRGRTIIYEIMKTNESLRKLILAKSGSDILADAAKKSGMESMYEMGIKKVLLGLTSLEELISTTRTAF
jgi:type II secretory ATPase GspE/PulE/Tfp pilus assembly ATPase PilB-like protein